MTQEATPRGVPALTLGWRLKMALGDMGAQQMADYLGVHRSTLTRWMSDKGEPPRQAFLRQWALATGTDYGWLVTGSVPPPSNDDGGTSPWAPRVSIPQPAGNNHQTRGYWDRVVDVWAA